MRLSDGPSAILAPVALLLAQTAVATPTDFLHGRAASTAKQYCTPSQPCWPNALDWAQLNNTVGGRLLAVRPWQSPCFPESYDAAKCAAVGTIAYSNTTTRANTVGAMEYDNWITCFANSPATDEDCTLPQLNLPTPQLGRTCGQGRIAPYAVSVSNAADVQAAIAFAKAKNVRLNIKNTGHDFLGRSAAPDSLTLWTHNLKSKTYTDNWQGTGNAAAVIGSGVQASELYAFAAQNNKAVTLGAYSSVGISGGFMSSGGHGPLAAKYGLAVDNILEIKIVTADGQFRTANAKTNSDLFWALRGGGGGTWGVIVESTYKLHQNTPSASASMIIPINPLANFVDTDASLTDFISALALYQANMTRAGWTGYTFVTSNNVISRHFNPDASDAKVTRDAIQPLLDHVQTSLKYLLPIITYDTFADVETGRSNAIPEAGESLLVPVGPNARLSSRHIPVSAFATNESRATLAAAAVRTYRQNLPPQSILDSLTDLSRQQMSLQIYATAPTPAAWGGPSGSDTGLNPSWRDTLWHTLILTSWDQPTDHNTRASLVTLNHNAMNNMRDLYDTGAYFNEADVLEEKWQQVFFGSNYQKLLSIKKKYDPNNLFIVWKGVGFDGQEGQSAFKCYQKS